MGFDLVSLRRVGGFHWNNFCWTLLLELALDHGWEPAGTLPPPPGLWPPDEPWDGSYGSNDGATVTAADAVAFADALERLLPHIPDKKADNEWLEEYRPLQIAATPSLRRHALYGEEAKQEIREFVAFCRESGGFRIS